MKVSQILHPGNQIMSASETGSALLSERRQLADLANEWMTDNWAGKCVAPTGEDSGKKWKDVFIDK